MANETDFERGQGGSEPSKPMPDPNDPTVRPTVPDETDPLRRPIAPDPARPEDWRDPNKTEKPDEDESSPSNN